MGQQLLLLPSNGGGSSPARIPSHHNHPHQSPIHPPVRLEVMRAAVRHSRAVPADANTAAATAHDGGSTSARESLWGRQPATAAATAVAVVQAGWTCLAARATSPHTAAVVAERPPAASSSHATTTAVVDSEQPQQSLQLPLDGLSAKRAPDGPAVAVLFPSALVSAGSDVNNSTSGAGSTAGTAAVPAAAAAAAVQAAAPETVALPPRLTSVDLAAYLRSHSLCAEVVPDVEPEHLSQQQQQQHGIIKSIVLVVEGLKRKGPTALEEGLEEMMDGGNGAAVPLLTVVRLQDRVDERRVADLLQVARRRVRLARPQEVLAATGFVVGTVPPFGHRRRLRTLVDTAITRLIHVYGGGGDVDKELSVAVPDLLSYTNAVVADIAAGGGDGGGESAAASSATVAAPAAVALPLPWSSGSQSVELVAVVAQRRRIAKLLQFVNLVPEQVLEQELPSDGQAVFMRQLWRHPEAGTLAEVQLIMGKTLERNVGREAAQALMDKVKVGTIVIVTGRVQPPPQRAAAPHPPATAAAAAASSAASQPTGPTAPPQSLPLPHATAVPTSPSSQQTQQRLQQQRPDVLDLACHSLRVLHTSKDTLTKALRAARRSGLGDARTATELFRLQQLYGSGAVLEGNPMLAVSERGVGAGAEDEVERKEVQERGRRAPRRRSRGPQACATSTAARHSSPVGVDANASGGGDGDGDGGNSPYGLAAGTAIAGTQDRTLGGAIAEMESAVDGEGPGSRRDGTSRLAALYESSATAGGAGALSGGGGGDEAVSLVAAAAAAAATAGWRMPLPPSAVRLVRSAADLAEVEQEVLGPYDDGDDGNEKKRAPLASAASPPGAAAAAAARQVVGLDCEWAPFERHQSKTPVSILQVATRECVYILDLLRLLAPPVPSVPAAPAAAAAGGDNLSAAALTLSRFLSRLMSSGEVVKLGFQLASDLDRLCESYPYLPCFTHAAASASRAPAASGSSGNSVSVTDAAAARSAASAASSSSSSVVDCRGCVDVLALARCLRPDQLGLAPQISLSRLVAMVLGEPLDKAQQTSDWARRPLSGEQLLYAATDAYCLVALYDTLLGLPTEGGSANDSGAGQDGGGGEELGTGYGGDVGGVGGRG